MRKLLYILSVLCTVSTFSIAQVNSMSLSKALSSSDIELDFNQDGKIWCSYANTNTFPHPVYISEKDYVFQSNAYFIFSNIIDLLSNTEGGGAPLILLQY